MVLNELILNSFGDAAEKGSAKRGRFVRLELPGKHKLLHIAEVQAFEMRMLLLRAMLPRVPLTMAEMPDWRSMEMWTGITIPRVLPTPLTRMRSPGWRLI